MNKRSGFKVFARELIEQNKGMNKPFDDVDYFTLSNMKKLKNINFLTI